MAWPKSGPPGWSVVSHTLGSAGHLQREQHPIYTLDLSPSDALAHSYGAVYTRKSHIDSENSKEHSGGMQGACTLGATRAAVSLCHRREVLNLSAQMWQLKQKIQTETHENIYEVIEVATSCETSYWRYTSEMSPLKWLQAHDLATPWVPTLPVTTQRILALHFRLSLHKQDFKQACELICVLLSKSALIFPVMWPELFLPSRCSRYWKIHILCTFFFSFTQNLKSSWADWTRSLVIKRFVSYWVKWWLITVFGAMPH